MSVVVLGLPVVLVGLSVLAVYLTVRLERTSGDRLADRRAEQPLAHELPYWHFADDQGVGVALMVDGIYASFFELSGMPTECAADERLNLDASGLQSLLQHLPAGGSLQLLYLTDDDVSVPISSYLANSGKSALGRALREAKARYLSELEGLRRSRLILGVSAPNRFQTALGYRWGAIKKFPSFGPDAHARSLEQLATLRSQIERGLASVGIGARPLSASESRGLVYAFLNPSRARLIPDPFAMHGGRAQKDTRLRSEPGGAGDRASGMSGAPRCRWHDSQSAREQLCFTGLTEHADHLVLGDHLVGVITLKNLPTFTEPALIDRLARQLPVGARLQVALEVLDDQKATQDLKRRRDQAHVLSTFFRERRNQEAEAQEEDLSDLIDRILRSSVRMARLSISIVLSVDALLPDAERHLREQASEVLRIGSSLFGAQFMVDELGQLDEFLATLPGNARHGRRFRQCTSENAAHLLPVWQPFSGSRDPALLLVGGRGNLIGISPFEESLDNPNAFMAGASGSGKSSTTIFILLNLLAAGAKALVIDIGGSYRRVIELFGGQYFSVTLDAGSDCALNPFFSHEDLLSGDEEERARRMAFLLSVIERMVVDKQRPELRHQDRAILAAAITKTYGDVHGRVPLLADLANTLRSFVSDDPEDVAIARALARDLRIWVEGPAARLIGRPSTINIGTDCAAFDLKGLENQEQLQAVVMMILSGLIWNLVMKDRTGKKLIVFDEVWKLLATKSSAQLVAELYRTSRKYRCSILAISQSVEDFTGSQIASALVGNSATKYLLKHGQGHDLIAKEFGLNASERAVFEDLQMERGKFTEVLMLQGKDHFLARVVPSPLEYWIATTHPADLAVLERLSSERGDLRGFDLLAEVSRLYPQGAGGESFPAKEAA